jgi:hypothetical protein
VPKDLMTGNGSKDHEEQARIPPALASFAAEEGLSVRDTLTLLRMQEQIMANRKSAKKNDMERVDWREFYKAIKEFL